jgi:hypothetical protein
MLHHLLLVIMIAQQNLAPFMTNQIIATGLIIFLLFLLSLNVYSIHRQIVWCSFRILSNITFCSSALINFKTTSYVTCKLYANLHRFHCLARPA